MSEIIQKINNKIKQLNFKLNQISLSKKDVKFFYIEQSKEIKDEIKDLQAQLIYYKNENQSNTIDIHGATIYFVDNYLDSLLYYKMNYNKQVKLITGRGSRTLFNNVKKYLDKENLKYTCSEIYFDITF
jgi:hypothetical protein